MADSDRVHVTPATVDDVDPVTDLWIALAEGQRAHGSTLLAEENRGSVREWVARSVVTAELLVARDGADDLIGFVGFALDRGGYERDRTRGVVSNLFVVPSVATRESAPTCWTQPSEPSARRVPKPSHWRHSRLTIAPASSTRNRGTSHTGWS